MSNGQSSLISTLLYFRQGYILAFLDFVLRLDPDFLDLDPRDLDRAKLDEIIEESDSDIIRTVASRLNVGRVYGAAICSKAGLSEDLSASSLDDEQRISLLDSIESMMHELEEGAGCIRY